jgi:hypothetical protein
MVDTRRVGRREGWSGASRARPCISRRVGRASRLACGAAAALVLCLTGLTACGGVPGDAVVVRVGEQAITKTTVDHWIGVIERGGAFRGFRGAPPRGTPKQRALALLITSSWLTDEAARQGVAVTESVVDEALLGSEREDTKFYERLHATGQTLADVKLEIRAELAAEAIREELARRAARIAPREVAMFYRSNQRLFRSPEERIVDVIEDQPSSSAVSALVSRLGTGPRFTKAAYHKVISRAPDGERTPEQARVAAAIFAARPGIVSPPMMLDERWAAFVVRKVLPGNLRSLANVHAEVLQALYVHRQRVIAAAFDREYRRRGVTETRCRSGYVGAGCPQAIGSLGAYEDPFSSRAHPVLSERSLTG